MFEEELQAELLELEEQFHCLSELDEGENLVFYFKMYGDFRRFWAEFFVDPEAETERTCQSLHALGLIEICTLFERPNVLFS